MKINLCSASLVISLALSPSLALAQPTALISIDCDNVSIEECSKQLPFIVVMDRAIAVHKTILHKITSTPLDGLRRMLDDSGITNYVISFDGTNNKAIVSYLSNGANGAAPGELPSGDNSITDGGKTFPPSVGGVQHKQVASYFGEMSIEELKARADKANEIKMIDPDEEISLLGGEKVSLRQLQAKLERVNVSVPAGDLNLSPVAGGERLTFDDIKAMQMRADAASQEARGLTLLNGVNISHQELKSLQALGQSAAGAAKGFLLQSNPSLPSGPGVIAVEK